MRRFAAWKFRPLHLLFVLLIAGAAWAGDPIPDIDIVLEQIPGGSLKMDSHSGGFDEIEVEVGKNFADAMKAVALPSGWTLEAEGKKVRLSGPALPAGEPVRFKLDVGSTPRPKKISYQVGLEGRTLLERRKEPVEPVPPQQVIGSLQGIVTMPSQVAPGEPMQIRVTDPTALPAGGSWSLSGTVVSEEELPEADEDGPDESVVAVFTTAGEVKVEDAAFATEFPVAHSRLVRFATEVAPSLPAGDPVYLTIAPDSSLQWDPVNPVPEVMTAEFLLMSDELDAQDALPPTGVIPWCRWWRPIPPQCRVKHPPNPCPNGIPSCPNHPVVAFMMADGTVHFDLPDDLQPGSELTLQYLDAFGDVVVDVPSVPGIDIVEPTTEKVARITSSSTRAFAGETACVCGSFPTSAAWNGILLDGESVGAPVSASSRMAWVTLPAGLSPGEHVFSGTTEPGFPAADRASTLVLQIGGELDSNKLRQLQTTPMRLWVIGTNEPADLRVRNLTPGIISIDGGEDQIIQTSGGSPNQLERSVRGLTPGSFDIKYELAGELCPCAAAKAASTTHYF